MKLKDLASLLGCELEGDGDTEITGVDSIEGAAAGAVTFAVSAKKAAALAESRASAVILPPGAPSHGRPALRTPLPQLAFARALRAFHPEHPPAPGVHPAAAVAASARVDPSASVGPYAVIEEDARIGARTQVRPFALVAAGVVVGEDCRIGSHVVLRAARLGNRVALHDGVMIGSDGFGYTPDERGLVEKIPQVGTVEIGDDVEVGALSAIDRATTGITRIGRGVKIDNFVMIAHNCEVGDFSLIAGQTGLSGSTRLGRGVLLGGQVGSPGHITIGDGARLAASSAPSGNIPAGATVSGRPAWPIATWRRAMVALERLPDLFRRVRRLERAVGIGREDEEK